MVIKKIPEDNLKKLVPNYLGTSFNRRNIQCRISPQLQIPRYSNRSEWMYRLQTTKYIKK